MNVQTSVFRFLLTLLLVISPPHDIRRHTLIQAMCTFWHGVMASNLFSLDQFYLNSEFDPHRVLHTFGLVLQLSCALYIAAHSRLCIAKITWIWCSIRKQRRDILNANRKWSATRFRFLNGSFKYIMRQLEELPRLIIEGYSLNSIWYCCDQVNG